MAIELDFLAARAAQTALSYDAHDLTGAPFALWRGVLPSGTGLSNLLRGAKIGMVPRRSRETLRLEELYVGLVTTALLGLIVNVALTTLTPRLVRWHADAGA